MAGVDTTDDDVIIGEPRLASAGAGDTDEQAGEDPLSAGSADGDADEGDAECTE